MGGASLVINHGKNGLLTEVGNVESLYIAMNRIIESPEFAFELSTNGIEVRNNYSLEYVGGLWEQIF